MALITNLSPSEIRAIENGEIPEIATIDFTVKYFIIDDETKYKNVLDMIKVKKYRLTNFYNNIVHPLTLHPYVGIILLPPKKIDNFTDINQIQYAILPEKLEELEKLDLENRKLDSPKEPKPTFWQKLKNLFT